MSALTPEREYILENRRGAEREMALLLAEDPLTLPFLETHLRRFILFKFQLSPDEVSTDSFSEITNQSLMKTAKLSKEFAAEVNNAKSCDGATSAMVKKALLFMAIQRLMGGITLDAAAAADCKTLSEFTGVVWRALLESVAWRDRLDGCPQRTD